MNRKWIIAVLGATVLNACAFQTPRPDADYGQPPQAYRAAIKQHFEMYLKDPESARYRFGEPAKAYGNTGLAYGGDVVWTGYLVDVMINAKNGFGGYTGFDPYVVLFDGNQVRRHFAGNNQLVHRIEPGSLVKR